MLSVSIEGLIYTSLSIRFADNFENPFAPPLLNSLITIEGEGNHCQHRKTQTVSRVLVDTVLKNLDAHLGSSITKKVFLFIQVPLTSLITPLYRNIVETKGAFNVKGLQVEDCYLFHLSDALSEWMGIWNLSAASV